MRKRPDGWRHSCSVQDPPKLCEVPSYTRSFPKKKRKNWMMIHFRLAAKPELHPSVKLRLPPPSVSSYSQAAITAIWNSRCFCAGNCERICRHLVISLEIRRRRASMPPVWSLCLLPYLAIPSAIGDCYISFFFLFSFPGSGI